MTLSQNWEGFIVRDWSLPPRRYWQRLRDFKVSSNKDYHKELLLAETIVKKTYTKQNLNHRWHCDKENSVLNKSWVFIISYRLLMLKLENSDNIFSMWYLSCYIKQKLSKHYRSKNFLNLIKRMFKTSPI